MAGLQRQGGDIKKRGVSEGIDSQGQEAMLRENKGEDDIKV
jgi:hypothetical protein